MNDNIDNMDMGMDEDIEKAFESFDALIDAMRDDLIADEMKTTVINLPKYKQMEFVYAALKYITKGTDAKVSYEMCEISKTMGTISVETDDFICYEPKWFARAAQFASNIEIYPLVNDKIRITFTFHGLTIPIE